MALKYRAFISYSHKDAQFARWLHSRLEGYRLPKALVGRVTARGPVPARLSPIFRDREELPAAHSLTAEVSAALDASQALLVVCSPAAKASQWVAREIELFRELHPDRPILLALMEGDPASSFPQVIYDGGDGVEPLAADFSDSGDGRKLGLLKLVAGLSGAPLGDLVQRDAQRKMRRVMAITALAGLVALIMAAMAIVALQARNEAERQRAEAEGLVEFMITDLRAKLDDVGRLDLLAVANDRALDYYRAQDLGSLDARSLALRAEVLHRIGADLAEAGDLAGALDAWEEAAATTRALYDADSDNPELIYADAQSSFYVGLAAWREIEYSKATLAWQRYNDLSDRLVAIDPANLDWQMEAGYSASNLGMVLLRTKGSAREALGLFEKALASFELVRVARPQDSDLLLELSDAHAWIADAHWVLGDYPAARLARNSQEIVLRTMQQRDPGNALYQRAWIGNAIGRANIERSAGQKARAIELMRENYARAARLAGIDRGNENLEIQRIYVLASLFWLDPASARALDRDVCGPDHQKIDPELALLCHHIGIAIAQNPAFTRLQCRLGDKYLSPIFGLEARRQNSSFPDECGDTK